MAEDLRDEVHAMADLNIKHQDEADETREFADKGRVEIFDLDGSKMGLVRMEPGWRWSVHVKPQMGTERCMAHHLGYCAAGRMKIRMESGEEGEIGPGDTFSISPGHDAWVEGDEAFVAVDFGAPEAFARKAPPAEAAPPPIH
ncbi:cupin domain-containing protein [Vulgatibacter incomptus]|uniref:Cupin 2 conserved barrel domain-containing protein n=1 Tax=Vulgatibacter incomptus TaxID=1391653 RepID=A0A0K1PHU2_9BACT|nr:cupin domain-containing protein [Vulgatibacter incomptus]AKU92971.1 hypothetical protein AKJ08_3358 [Vulgatibacter incomptus]